MIGDSLFALSRKRTISSDGLGGSRTSPVCDTGSADSTGSFRQSSAPTCIARATGICAGPTSSMADDASVTLVLPRLRSRHRLRGIPIRLMRTDFSLPEPLNIRTTINKGSTRLKLPQTRDVHAPIVKAHMRCHPGPRAIGARLQPLPFLYNHFLSSHSPRASGHAKSQSIPRRQSRIACRSGQKRPRGWRRLL